MNDQNEITTETQATQIANAAADVAPMTASEVLRHVTLVTEITQSVMKDGEHYGVIPGTQKPTLYKAGAEKLMLAFRLVPNTRITRTDLPGGHREYEVGVTLTARDGTPVSMGNGLCSTMESKYRYRSGGRKCPQCGEPAIAKSKPEYGGGWYCNAKRGGCGAKFAKGDPKIESVSAGRPENPDIADTYNTVLKMAKKRALVDAVISATAASDCFAQDLEDLDIHVDEAAEREASRTPMPDPKPATVRTPAGRPPEAPVNTVAPPQDAVSSEAEKRSRLLVEAKRIARRIHGEPGGGEKLAAVKAKAGVPAPSTYDDYAADGGDLDLLLAELERAEEDMGVA